MKTIRLFRSRYMPDEIIELTDDEILCVSEDYLITRWHVLKPRKDIDHGISIYYLKKGFKISKIFDARGQMVYWYCDIIYTQRNAEQNTYTFHDLLADVLIYPDGHVEVVDLGEISDIMEAGTLEPRFVAMALRRTDELLSCIYQHRFDELTAPLEPYL